jgi:hypothetical protein
LREAAKQILAFAVVQAFRVIGGVVNAQKISATAADLKNQMDVDSPKLNRSRVAFFVLGASYCCELLEPSIKHQAPDDQRIVGAKGLKAATRQQ